ncbi:MAG: hypothetical protein K2X47_17525 [Bdellovibrionales bacterium]|nr:hypothetical protein [Bdellovibrionales bacterium]
MKTLSLALFTIFYILNPSGHACNVTLPKHAPSAQLNDALVGILSSQANCPTTIQALSAQARGLGLTITPAMVANRGFHNPDQGSFSFFEEITGILPGLPPLQKGHFFWGHFTTVNTRKKTLSLDQSNGPGKLLIELIAWDFKKQVYNFYELIGGQPEPRWFYRGDSTDIWHDNQKLYRVRAPQEPLFGQRLRCSACHASGGPIMKELKAPHNDWWKNERPLWLKNLIPDQDVSDLMANLQDASFFSKSVLTGIQLLEDSPMKLKLMKAATLQELLRPVFCDQEINLVSAPLPLQSSPGAGSSNHLEIPSTAFRSPLFGSFTLSVSKQTYLGLLQKFAMNFPETKLPDADHPWLTPVKGESDLIAIEHLVQLGIVDQEFVADVAAVEMSSALLSNTRCELLKAIPNRPYFVGWRNEFITNLKQASDIFKGASELLSNLTSPAKNLKAHQQQAKAELAQIQKHLEQSKGAVPLFEDLIAKRQSVFAAEISKNPKGQILEPGFRVIFPTPH